MELKGKTFLFTECAGFIESNLSARFVSEGMSAVGVDSMNDYYGVRIKGWRLENLQKSKEFKAVKGNISDKDFLFSIFETHSPDATVTYDDTSALERDFALRPSTPLRHFAVWYRKFYGEEKEAI